MTAQNVLPVIDEPTMMFVPWPIQTTPVRKSNAPTTRLTMVTPGPYARPGEPVCSSARARDEHVLEVLTRSAARAAVDVPAQPGLESQPRAREDLGIEVAPVVDDHEHG